MPEHSKPAGLPEGTGFLPEGWGIDRSVLGPPPAFIVFCSSDSSCVGLIMTGELTRHVDGITSIQRSLSPAEARDLASQLLGVADHLKTS